MFHRTVCMLALATVLLGASTTWAQEGPPPSPAGEGAPPPSSDPIDDPADVEPPPPLREGRPDPRAEEAEGTDEEERADEEAPERFRVREANSDSPLTFLAAPNEPMLLGVPATMWVALGAVLGAVAGPLGAGVVAAVLTAVIVLEDASWWEIALPFFVTIGVILAILALVVVVISGGRGCSNTDCGDPCTGCSSSGGETGDDGDHGGKRIGLILAGGALPILGMTLIGTGLVGVVIAAVALRVQAPAGVPEAMVLAAFAGALTILPLAGGAIAWAAGHLLIRWLGGPGVTEPGRHPAAAAWGGEEGRVEVPPANPAWLSAVDPE